MLREASCGTLGDIENTVGPDALGLMQQGSSYVLKEHTSTPGRLTMRKFKMYEVLEARHLKHMSLVSHCVDGLKGDEFEHFYIL